MPRSGVCTESRFTVDVGEGAALDVVSTGASAALGPPVESGDSLRLASLTRLCIDISVADPDGPASGEDGIESGRGVDVGDKGCHTTSTLAACAC